MSLSRFRSFTIATLATPCLVGLAAPAAAQDAQREIPKEFADAMACRDLADDAERLACYDSAVGALAEAQAEKSILVVSREEVEETRRGLFGLKLPRIRLFSGGDSEEEKFSQITTTIGAVSKGRGGYNFTLEDGAVWAQTDSDYLSRPKSGQSITIEKGALGSYWGRVEDGRKFRIKRIS